MGKKGHDGQVDPTSMGGVDHQDDKNIGMPNGITMAQDRDGFSQKFCLARTDTWLLGKICSTSLSSIALGPWDLNCKRFFLNKTT